MIYPLKIFFIVLSCAVAIASVTAETLYKSVNEKGEVTFSDSPPENAARVEQIKVDPAPTIEQQRESMKRESRIEEQANEIGSANASRAEERAAAEPQEVPEPVDEVETYNRVYDNYPGNRNPARPVQPLPGRPVQLPAGRPIARPAR